MSLQHPKVFKVLHQSHSIAQYHPKATQDVLWPCLRFAISLQAKADQDLNLFESTLLRLLGEGGGDLKELSQQMGLTNKEGTRSSLAEFLCLKLQQLNLITDRLKLTHEGEQVLEKINSTQTRVVGATVYFDLINHCWLPVISRGEIQPVHAEQSSEGLVEFSQGSVGNAKQIKARPLLSETLSKKAPSERDVIDMIKRSRQQNKKLKIYSASTNSDGFVTSSGTISVNPDGELVYLHCYAFMVAGGKSSYVSDGFRSTTQERFTRGFNNPSKREGNPSIKSARDKLWRKSSREYQRQAMEESPSLRKTYQLLISSKVSNATENSEYKYNLSKFVSQSYAELEQMLSECYAFSKLKSCISELSTDPKSNAELATKVASHLGFQTEDGKLVKKLLKTNKGSVIHLKADKPVMSPLLLCHLLAARGDVKQPMAKLAQEYPLLLKDIARLRHWRNPIDHGDSADALNVIGAEEINFIHQLVEQVRQLLSEWIKDMGDQTPEQTIPNWLKDDIRSKARYRLEQDFGLMRSRMSERVYKGLFDALVHASSKDARDRTNALAGSLQHALYQACQALDANEAKDIESVKRELASLGAEQITKSNSHKVQLALKGGNATLGANFIAFWVQITDQQQRDLQSDKGFVKAVDRLDKIRGHSGPVIGQHGSLNEIEKTVFKLIKRLMEQYCG
ncbi:hypothetical protein L2729_11820 [Shewanella gelidimarina]|uniref:hypothetical protein n=1 Tax=Shewanella gelidimarina TaxID=56813 RepID=UPI00200C9C03|nr:hypothetical protein [Shewanella gelidimarina]MCL1058674.1 hypothetical protein [Shewanella gelidimarina]